MLTEGKIVECDVVGVIRGKGQRAYYQIKPVGDDSDRLFLTEPLRFYRSDMPPVKVFCRVYGVDTDEPLFVQDEYKALTMLYSPTKVYPFNVLQKLPDSLGGKRRYMVSALPNYQHIYTAHRGEVLNVGESVNMLVTVKKCPDGSACLYYKWVLDDQSEFSPQALFERCGHANDYEEFFVRMFNQKDQMRDKAHLFDDMQAKLSEANRLWALDYLSILYVWIFLLDGHPLEKIKRACKLLMDIDIWMLEENGLMMAFSTERRDDTLKRVESDIQRAQLLSEACDLILANGQDAFLESQLKKLRKTRFLRDADRCFRMLQYINKLDKEFVGYNLLGVCELLSFLPNMGNSIDSEPLKAVLNKLVFLMNLRRKEVNQQLLFDYSARPDRVQLAELVLLMGATLGAICAYPELEPEDFGLKERMLFAEMCRYLSLLTTRERGLRLMDQSTAYLLNGETKAPWNRPEIYRVTVDPEELVDLVLNMPIKETGAPQIATTSLVLMRTNKGALSLAKLPKGTSSGDMSALATDVYEVPGTSLRVASLLEREPWPTDASLLFYRDKWKAIQEQESVLVQSNKDTGVLIRTKALNKAYKGLVFCRSVDDSFFMDGAIGYHGYARHFRITDLTQVFSEDLLLVADVIRQSDGHILFDITRNLITYSQERATVGEKYIAHCLGYNRESKQPFFVSREGVMCKGVPDSDSYYQINGGYEVELLDLGGEDFPTCKVLQPASVGQKISNTLRKQLQDISVFNSVKTDSEGVASIEAQKEWPYIHRHMHHYLFLVEGQVARYNTLHILRLIALRERSSLNSYYSGCIQQLEMRACHEAGVPYVTSLGDFQLDEEVLTQYPSLRSFAGELKRYGRSGSVENCQPEGIGSPAGDGYPQELMLRFYDSGAYMLGEGLQPALPLTQLRLSDDLLADYVVLCYADGCLCKVSLDRVWSLRRGELLRPDSDGQPSLLFGAFALAGSEAVVLRVNRGQGYFVKVVPVAKIDEVASLGVPGVRFLQLLPGDHLEVFGLRGDCRPARKLVDLNPDSLGFKEGEVLESVEWLRCRIRDNEPQRLLGDTLLLEWLQTGRLDRILYYLSEVRLYEELRDKQAIQMRQLLDACPDGDSFWRLTGVLLLRSLSFYGPIVESKMEELGLDFLSSTGDAMHEVIRLLLLNENHVAYVVRLFYPLRSLLADQDKALFRAAKKFFRVPVLYLQLIEMAGYSVPELKELLVQDDSVPARYALFEVLRREYENGVIDRSEVVTYLERWNKRSVLDGFSQDLFWVGVLGEEPQVFPMEGIKRILEGGYQVFLSAVLLRWEEVDSFCQGYLKAYIGNVYTLTIEAAYDYHYLAWLGKVPVFIPRSWCVGDKQVDQSIQVRVVRGMNKQRILYAAECGVADPLPDADSLLKVGDQIKLVFERQNNNKVRALIRGHFARIRLAVLEYPAVIDANRLYTAVVEDVKDVLTYMVRLV